MKTANRVFNLTAAIFYFSVHVIMIVAGILSLVFEDTYTGVIIFGVGAIITYRPYKQAAERSQRSLGVEHNYNYTTRKPGPVDRRQRDREDVFGV